MQNIPESGGKLLVAELQISILPLIENLEWLYIWGVVCLTASSVGPSVGRSGGRSVGGFEDWRMGDLGGSWGMIDLPTSWKTFLTLW